MFFRSIQGLVQGGTLTLKVSPSQDGKMSVMLANPSNASLPVISVTASADELDAELLPRLASWSQTSVEVADHLKALDAQVARKASEAVAEKEKAVTEKASSKVSTAKKAKPVAVSAAAPANKPISVDCEADGGSSSDEGSDEGGGDTNNEAQAEDSFNLF